jgi:hypothetical protein
MSKKTLRTLALEVVDTERDVDFLREIAEKTNKKLKKLDPDPLNIKIARECYTCQHEIFVDGKSIGLWDATRIAKWYRDHDQEMPKHFNK